ncbi:NDP-sugar synthase [Euryarchaeota archaeon]|nr:NDP-sugar synthase [Euryarchaeota archaeon]MDC3299645.1 NDP-sugar synthase [Euryarchaeota archaeon]
MDVVVLAGGFGTRLRPWTEGRAKPLLPVLDKTLLERVVECVPNELIDRVVIAAGYSITEMEKFFSSSDLPYDIIISVEDNPLGTGGAIAKSLEHLTGNGPVLILNGDLVSSVDVNQLLNHHQEKKASITLSLWHVDDPSRFGVCGLDESGMITRFQEKPEPGTEFSNLINAGCYLIERDILESLSSKKHSMEREVFPLIADAGKMSGLEFKGYFVDAGTPSSFIDATQVCISNKRYTVGSISNESWFYDDIISGSIISGSSVSSDVTIGDGCEIVDCVILSGAKIGNGCKLFRCLIGESCIINNHSNISDKVIGHHEII